MKTLLLLLFFIATINAQIINETFSDFRADSTAGYRKALYRLNNSNPVTDLTGNGFTLTKNATGADSVTVNFSPVVYGDSVYYTTGDDYFNRSGSIILTSDFTVSIWFKTSNNPAANQQLSNEDDLNTLRDWKLLDHNTNDKLRFDIRISDTEYTVTTTTTSSGYLDGNWHNVTASHDGDSIRIYLDGTKENSTLASGSVDNDNANFSIAYASFGGGSQYYTGHIAQVVVDTVALSDKQIRELIFLAK